VNGVDFMIGKREFTGRPFNLLNGNAKVDNSN
jgi:hypothetical protein